MAIASSRRLESDDPRLALALYPLNAEALLAQATDALGRAEADAPLGEMEGPLDEIERKVRAAIPLDAGDARIYSLLGEILRRRGQEEAAYAMFDHALVLARTEIHALQWSIQRAVDDGDYRQAVERLDVMFRRWPERIEPLAGALPAVFSSPEGYAALLERIGAGPPWRPRLLSVLGGDAAPDLGFAARLLQDLAVSSLPPTPGETARLLAGLFKRKQYDLAYRTFLLTLAPQEKELSGLVFDGAFRQAPSARRFDWAVRRQPGVTLTLPAGLGDSPSGAGLSVEFNGTPVQRVGVEQYLHLPPGGYEIEIKASAVAAELPKALLWSLDCLDPGQPVLRTDVPAGSYSDRIVAARFSVPQNCPVQLLTLRTNAVAESWSNRYGGRILFHHIRISAVQA